MTAEEFEKKENWFLNKDFPLPKAGLSVSVPYSKKQMRWLMEAYANQKVLEALKKDLKELSDCYKAHAEDNPRKEACQVLHTLIMEKQEQIRNVKQKR